MPVTPRPPKRRPLRPGSPEYWRRYGAGSLLPGPGRADLLRIAPRVVLPAPGPEHTMGITGGEGYVAPDGQNPWTGSFTPPGGSWGKVTIPPSPADPKAPAAPPAAAHDPWQEYLDRIDARERAIFNEQSRLRAQRAAAMQQALAGFGIALQGNAAEQWGKVIESYGRAGDGATAFSEGLASSYGQGLTDANRQIAQDFAAIGQEGGPAIRDDAAALEQIATVGGARPGEMAGLVGRAWGSYGETRPGTIGFMTGQNIAQVAREALQADEDAALEFAKAMSDNPAEAMQMWMTMEEYKAAKTKTEADAKMQEFEMLLAQKKEAREARAFELQVQQFNLQYGKEFAAQASTLSKNTGTVWIYNPKTGKLQNTGRPTESRRAAQAREATSRRNAASSARNATTSAARAAEQRRHNQQLEAQARTANAIKQQNANTTQAKAAAAADKAKGTGGLTPNQVVIRENAWINQGVKAVNTALGIKNASTAPKRKPPKKADLVRQVYNQIGRQLAGKIPRWTEGYLKSLINAYLETLPRSWWAKNFEPSSGTEPGL